MKSCCRSANHESWRGKRCCGLATCAAPALFSSLLPRTLRSMDPVVAYCVKQALQKRRPMDDVLGGMRGSISRGKRGKSRQVNSRYERQVDHRMVIRRA